MAQHAARPGNGGLTRWIGWILFVGIVMMISGLIGLIQGLVALFDDDFYQVRAAALAIDLDYTAWGWTLVVLGALLIGAGYAVMFGHTWARLVALCATAVNAFVNLMFLAAYPIWSVIAISLSLIAIYALAVHGGEGRALRAERR